MAPVISALRAAGHEAPLLVTAQHRQLLDQMLAVFQLTPQWDLDVMQADQHLAALTGRLLPALDVIFAKAKPDLVVAQGDTVTVFAAALSCIPRSRPPSPASVDLQSSTAERGLTARMKTTHR